VNWKFDDESWRETMAAVVAVLAEALIRLCAAPSRHALSPGFGASVEEGMNGSAQVAIKNRSTNPQLTTRACRRRPGGVASLN
jgi:hypothetical protein